MSNHTQNNFIRHVCDNLPERRGGKRGPNPIPKEIIITELFKLFRTNCGWRNIKHSSTCREYLKEIHRRGLLTRFFHFMNQDIRKFRLQKTIIDSSDIVSYNTNGLVKYSGKYHNYCVKITVETTPEYVPVWFSINTGSTSDSEILDKKVNSKSKLPYELFLDMGYERYNRRRQLKKLNCQVRMEMKNKVKNRKRGPRFDLTDQQKKQRGQIEKVFAWLKSFAILKNCRLRIKSMLSATFIFCLSYITFMRLQKL